MLTVIKQSIKLVLVKGLIKLVKIATNRNLNLVIAKTILCFIPLQAKIKELELLCSLKNVEFDPIEQEKSVGKLM